MGGPLEESAGRPVVRATDAEREAMVARLQAACGEGRLTLDEFSDRVSAALEARTTGELELLTTDLPAVAAPVPPAWQPPRRTTSWAIGIMSGSEHKGRWHPAPTTNAFAFMGAVKLDLRQAQLDGPELVINAVAFMGGIDVVVPDGIQVEMTGLAIFGGKDCRVKDVQPVPGSPVVRVRVFAFMGAVTVRTGKDRSGRHHPRHASHGHRPHRPASTEERSDRFATEAGEAVSELRAMPVDGTVTVLFTDVEDFTGLSERLGDIEASHLLRRHQALVRRVVDEHGGVEVTCQGDGFMVAFDGARRALRSAVAIQRAIEADGSEMRVRMGLHTGEAIREDEDLFGRTVIVAARIAAAASGGEILVSSLLRQLSDGSGEFAFGPSRGEILKGLPGVHDLHPVAWRQPLVP